MLSAASLNTMNNEDLDDLQTKSVDGRMASARKPMLSNFGQVNHIKVLQDNQSFFTKVGEYTKHREKYKDVYDSVDCMSRNQEYLKLYSDRKRNHQESTVRGSCASIGMNSGRSKLPNLNKLQQNYSEKENPFTKIQKRTLITALSSAESHTQKNSPSNY